MNAAISAFSPLIMPSPDEWNLFDRWVASYKEVIAANVGGNKEWFVAQGELHLEITIHGPSLMDSKHEGLISIKRGFTFTQAEPPMDAIVRVLKEVAKMRTRVVNMVEHEWRTEKSEGK